MKYIFQSTRLRLTALSLLIIMSISLTFSLVIYQRFSAEIARISRTQQSRQERFVNRDLPPIDASVFDEARERLITNLFLINSVIFIISGGLAYALVGKVLEPINDMIEEQRRFIADASHELRTPLTALKTEVEVSLRDKTLKLDDARALLESNLEEINKLRALSDNLLMIAKHGDVAPMTVFSNVQLKEVIDESLTKVKPLAEQKHIIIHTTYNDTVVRGDHNALVNLFVILLDNAIKYSDSGAPESQIIVTTHISGKYAEVRVQDFGIGINATDLPHVFQRFYRADAARTRQESGGYGLGLSIAQQIVERHHGRISVTSELHKGSTFSVMLPIMH